MGDEFEDTSVDTGSDVDTSSDSGESFDDSSMDAGDEAIEDSGTEGLDDSGDSGMDDSGESFEDSSMDAGDEPIDDSGAEGLDDSDAGAPTDESSEATDNGANDLPDGDAEGTDEPADENSEATDDSANDLPDGDAEGTDEPVDESSEATDDGANDLPDSDAEGTDEPDDESSEAADDGANDLPDGDAADTDEPADENSEATDDGANDLPDSDAEGTDEPADKNGEATNDGESDYSNEEWDVDSGLSDAERAKNDLDYANEQYDIYKDNVANGIQEPNAEMEQGLQDAVNYAQGHYDDVTNGAPYSYNKPSDYWRSDEGRSVSGAMGKGMSKILSQTGMGKDPTGNVDSAMSSFAQEAMPHIADGSQKLMENTYNQFATPGDKYMQDHFMRDANGTPITAEEGKAIALGESSNDASLDTKDFNDLKNEYFDDLKSRSEYPDTIDDSIKNNEWKKIDPELNGEMRDEFGNSKNKLISDWENQNNTKWPTYSEDVYSPNGKLIRQEGDKYDAHHIQPLTYGGENRAENITPLHASEHFDKQGVHSPDSPFGRMEKMK